MAGRMDMGRIKESVTRLVQKVTSKIQKRDSHALSAEEDQQTVEVIESTPLWKKKSVQFISGAVILLIVAGIIGVQQYQQYIKNNTFEIYHVYQNGVKIGTVDTKEQVEQLIESKKSELAIKNPGIHMVLETGEITYESQTALKLYADTEETLKKLTESFTSYAEGVAVVVDGKKLGVVKDEETAARILHRLQSEYAPSLAAEEGSKRTITQLSYNEADDKEKAETTEAAIGDEPGSVITEVGFVEDVNVDTISVDPSEITDADELYNTIIQGSTKPTKYIVQPGDCIGCIAHKFEISDQVIYENNPWINGDRITVGDELDLTVRRPEITVHTTETQVEIEEIAAPIQYVQNDKMKKGETKTIKQGSPGSQKLTYSVYKENGYIISEELVSKEVIVEATPTVIEKGTLIIAGTGTGQFAYPVSNYRLSSKYGSRWGRNHKGIDLTGNKNIKAADAGEVEFVGNKNGYGKTIIINHKNGFKTLYAHLKSYNVSKGDKVDKGDKIGVMGSTGRSTGVHLHFEIIKNGRHVNPLSYL